MSAPLSDAAFRQLAQRVYVSDWEFYLRCREASRRGAQEGRCVAVEWCEPPDPRDCGQRQVMDELARRLEIFAASALGEDDTGEPAR